MTEVVKTLKYYIFKFRTDKLDIIRNGPFCPYSNFIDTHELILGYKLTKSEQEMQYVLDKFLRTFNCIGHDVSNMCIIPKSIFNESCIYEHIGHKVYLISPVYLNHRCLYSYKFPEMLSKIYDTDLADIWYLPKEETDKMETMEIVKSLYGEDTDG